MYREPFCCPVCGGRGTVSYKFYEPFKNCCDNLDTTSTNPYIKMTICRTCGGTGIVWPPEETWEITY